MNRLLLLAAVFLLSCQSIPLSAQVLPSSYTPLAPCRILDTRIDPGSPWAANSTHYLDVIGLCNVPEGANAVALNLAVVDPAAGGYLLAWGGEIARPVAASLTHRGGPGSDSSFTLVRLCYPAPECGDHYAIYTLASTHVVVDVVGYFEPLPE